MHLELRNVNAAFFKMVHDVHYEEIWTVRQETRNGPVLRIPDPVTISYQAPMECVLFNHARDCNPFFHLVEAMWMLGGRNDLATLTHFLPSYKDYSDDGKRVNGAYGHRWRHHFGYDQLEAVIQELHNNPTSRRCVLQMWDATRDWMLATNGGKDVPCNTQAYVEIDYEGYVNLTVCNRSNDMIWGTFGANIVHFAFLAEYIACSLGRRVGNYHQISNNLHIYADKFFPKKLLEAEGEDHYMTTPGCVPQRLFTDKLQFDKDLYFFLYNCIFVEPMFTPQMAEIRDPFISGVAVPMVLAFNAHRVRNYTLAYEHIKNVKAMDWRLVGKQWLKKRELNYLKK